jgi:hypothetical protein
LRPVSPPMAGMARNNLPSEQLSPLAALLLAAAGMVQRWRQQTRAACQQCRTWRAMKKAEAKRAERDRLPPASRVRSVAHFQLLAMESTAEAHTRAAAGDLDMARTHHAEAAWFAGKARNLAGWDRQGEQHACFRVLRGAAAAPAAKA